MDEFKKLQAEVSEMRAEVSEMRARFNPQQSTETDPKHTLSATIRERRAAKMKAVPKLQGTNFERERAANIARGELRRAMARAQRVKGGGY